MALTYSETLPTVRGYYWERRANNRERIIFLDPVREPRLRPWREHRAEGLSFVREDEPEKLAALEALPEEDWKVEYAGPIEHPQ